MSEGDKYQPLRDRLRRRPHEPAEIDLEAVADLVGGLPDSAYRHRAWWANNITHTQAGAWLTVGRRVDHVDLHHGQVRFSAAQQPEEAVGATPEAHADKTLEPESPPSSGVSGFPWDAAWYATAETMREHLQAGRAHLLTEDVLRFALARALEDTGVDVDRLHVEQRVTDIGALDLTIDMPPTTAVELKYPRDPKRSGAADTMTHGELLADFYRLGRLGITDAWTLQLLDERLRGYLARREEVRWTWTPGETFVLDQDCLRALPETAQRALPTWAHEFTIHAECRTAYKLEAMILAAYQVEGSPGGKANAP